MQIRWRLLFWIFRQLRWLTLVTAATSSLYVLFSNERLDFQRDSFAIVFVLLHSFLISRLMGRVRSEQFAFLYSQGIPRNVLWCHTWLAALSSVLATGLLCAVLIVTPLRGMFQNALQNPWFPLMAATEWPFLVWSLLVYAMVLPVVQYEWIRSATPYRDITSGHLLSLGFLTFAVLLANRFSAFDPLHLQMVFIAVFAMVPVSLGIFGQWLHRRMEVRS